MSRDDRRGAVATRGGRSSLPRILAALCLATSVPVLAQNPRPFTVSETGAGFDRLSDAVDAIGAGSATILIAAGRYSDCAVQGAGSIAYVADTPGTVTFDGGICEGKATLVLRGQKARVDGLRFTHEHVDDGNGAGIRIERGDLAVDRSRFVDAQSGILSADDPTAAIAIDRSTFAGLGKDPTGHGAHAVYIGHYRSLTIRRSRFERGTGGHYVKSRAPHVDIRDSSFDDSHGIDTNYMIDLSNGATGEIAGNVFLSGVRKENHSVMIAVAAEGASHRSTGLVITRNIARVAPGFPRSTAFVGNWSHDRLREDGNLLADGVVPYANLAYRAPLHRIGLALSSLGARLPRFGADRKAM